ncbi:MAG: hypothetical protein HC910_22795 [Spirulinaceae cyanobacterium SM2_1_0]|nr:hypothetical protein [Spirulinaceae cyanobacterium SM2_1_0]
MAIATPLNERTGLITLSKRNKIQGRFTKVFVGLPPFGTRNRLTPQTLVANAHRSTVTVGGTAGAGNYVVTINNSPLPNDVYAYVASASDTNLTIRDGLISLINSAGKYRADGAAGNATSATFVLSLDSAFTEPTATAPVGATLTAGTVTAGAMTAKGATSIALSYPTITRMEIGQAVTFRTADETEVLAQLTAVANVGATSLTVRPLQEEIPSGAIAEFPAYIADLTGSPITRSFTRAAAEDYNTGVVASGVIVGGESSISLPGNFAYNNAGAVTLRYAASQTLEVFVERRFDPPSINFRTGQIEWSYGVVTSASDDTPNDSFISQGFEMALNIESVVIDPIGV